MSSERYYDEYWRREQPSPLGDPLRPTRIDLAHRELTKSGARTVLDAGCGAGEVVGELRRRGFEVDGMEVSDVALDLARRREPDASFVRHSVETLPWPYPAGSFDAVLSFEVIEHLLEPSALLHGVRTVLKVGGGLGVTTPYHGRAKNLVIAATRFDKHFDVVGDHVRFFSDASLGRLLEGNGFEVVKISHFGRRWPLSAGMFVWAKKR